MDTNRGLRRTAIVVLPVAAVLTLAACGPDIAAVHSGGNQSSRQFTDTNTVPQSIDRVNIDNDAGDVTISVGAGPTTVRRIVRYSDNRPDATTSVAGSVLDLRSCGHNCFVDYQVQVPVGTSVTGSVASGDVTLTGVADVDVRSVSGDVRVDGATGDVHAKSVSGTVDVNGAKGDLSATTVSGDIDVDTPANSSYRVITSTLSGDVHVTTPNDPTGAHTLKASTLSGDVRIQAQ
ncbi:MAG TPA: DUF4097 family beta strand repeat-containing protein [Pseudonocardiaceae bacterium]|nr:DUF4097 family beta strand repeat-containing protein [Pseudonocardiaceae bacterium]